MGYLITVKYHPKKQDGTFGFDLEEVLEKKFKIGKKEEEISEQQLAIAVLKQLSRRDIYINNIEIIQYVEKVIKVKESKNGIIIGGKKYSFNDVQDLECTIEEEVPPQQPQQQLVNTGPIPAPANFVQRPVPTRNVIKQEFFDPAPAYKQFNDQFQKMGLTIGKKYDIIHEFKAGDITYKYRVINDNGGTAEVPIEHWTATLVNDTREQSNEIDLAYPGEVGGSGQLRIR